ncbi:MAG: hypothetical protein IKN12_09030 [Selenomonadaceae bacterium]|nr:hypothetical protein [Selenomonadaceae bacterium]
MITGKRKFDELPANEQLFLSNKYGFQPKSSGYSKYAINYVRSLTDSEKILFQKGSFLTPHFLTQSLYKLKGSLQPIRFNRIIKDHVDKYEWLRTNYIQIEDSAVAVVFDDRKDIPSAVFRSLVTMDEDEINASLRTIMEADMREGFDIERGHLIRFSIYKTNEDEYAVLVTMAHLIYPYVNLSELFHEALGFSVEKRQEQSVPISYNMADPQVKSYWEKILESLPNLPKIPYVKQNVLPQKPAKVYRKKLSSDLTSELLRISKSNRMLLMAIIESAWSILLAEYNNIKDIYFSAVLPDKKVNAKVPSVKIMPVRIKMDTSLTVEQFVMNSFQQLLVSKPYSSLQINELKEISGISGKLFNHFLSFYDFMEEEKEYSSVQGSDNGELVLRNSWDSGGSNLGLYFQYENGSITLTLIYNPNTFANSEESFLVERFFQVILQMMTDYNLPMSMFLARLAKRFEAEENKETDIPNLALYLNYEITGIEIFKGLHHGEDITYIQRNTALKTFFEGDRISGKELKDSFVFVLKGRIARNVDTGDGWYVTLDILKDRSFLNATSFLEKPRLPISLEVLTDEAQIIFIKKEAVEKIAQKDYNLCKSIITYALGEMEKYQYLWIQS